MSQMFISYINNERGGEDAIGETDYICNNCRQSLIRFVNRNQENNTVGNALNSVNTQHLEAQSMPENLSSLLSEVDSNDLNGKEIQVPFETENELFENCETSSNGDTGENTVNSVPFIFRCAITHHRCIFNCKSGVLKCVPLAARRSMLLEHSFYVPPNCRWCISHSVSEDLSQLIQQIKQTNKSITEAQFFDIFSIMKSMITEKRNAVIGLDMNSERVMKEWTGLSIEQFNRLLTEVPQLNRDHLFMYLAKLRTGDSDERIATLFNLHRRTVEQHMQKVREALTDNFVRHHLGIQHLNRNILKENMTKVSQGLFCANNDDNIITIWDGTYIYIQKSSNYAFQRKTYSMQKKRPLIKPMMVVTPNGYILETFGPYPANLNDAEIMNKILAENTSLSELFIQDDIFLVDRGFRDSLDVIINKGYIGKMPDFIEGNATQLNWKQANQTRLVTKCRYVVEAINSRMKNVFGYFGKVWNNQSVPHLMQDFRIAAALSNAYFKRFESDKDDWEHITEIMLQRTNLPNHMAVIVSENNLNRKQIIFSDIDSCEVEFPLIDEEDLKLISLGTYQIRQAASYYAEHIKEDGKYRIQICKDNDSLHLEKYDLLVECPILLRARIQSRHQNKTKYFMYVLVDLVTNGIEGIKAYYCQCKNGERTVGCCAHVMTIIWYLAFARYEETLKHPAAYLDRIFDDAETDEENK